MTLREIKRIVHHKCVYKIFMLFSAREPVPECETLLVHILARPQNPWQCSASAAAHAGCRRGQGGITGQRARHCALQVICNPSLKWLPKARPQQITSNSPPPKQRTYLGNSKIPQILFMLIDFFSSYLRIWVLERIPLLLANRFWTILHFC